MTSLARHRAIFEVRQLAPDLANSALLGPWPATEADALPPVLRRETDAHTAADYSFSTHSIPKKEKAPR